MAELEGKFSIEIDYKVQPILDEIFITVTRTDRKHPRYNALNPNIMDLFFTNKFIRFFFNDEKRIDKMIKKLKIRLNKQIELAEKYKDKKEIKMTKYMDIKEFRELGFLQEVNRRFLHQFGLALKVVVDEDGTESLGGIWDYRDDPEGIRFKKGVISLKKAIHVESLRLHGPQTIEGK